jgi:hypothetical protein
MYVLICDDGPDDDSPEQIVAMIIAEPMPGGYSVRVEPREDGAFAEVDCTSTRVDLFVQAQPGEILPLRPVD